jgi:hypothetical protein
MAAVSTLQIMLDGVLVPHHRDYDMIQITPMRPNLTYQNHFDAALANLLFLTKYKRKNSSFLHMTCGQ